MSSFHLILPILKRMYVYNEKATMTIALVTLSSLLNWPITTTNVKQNHLPNYCGETFGAQLSAKTCWEKLKDDEITWKFKNLKKSQICFVLLRFDLLSISMCKCLTFHVALLDEWHFKLVATLIQISAYSDDLKRLEGQ